MGGHCLSLKRKVRRSDDALTDGEDDEPDGPCQGQQDANSFPDVMMRYEDAWDAERNQEQGVCGPPVACGPIC